MLLTRLIIIVVLFLAGGGLIAAGVHPLRQIRASRAWVPARGEITGVAIRIWGSSRRVRSRILWGVVVDYDYRVGGYRYAGSRRHFTIWRLGGLRRAEAEAVAARFVPGAPVTVWHDPDAPGDSVLERTVDWSSATTCLTIGALFSVMALYYTLVLTGLIPAWD